MQTIYAATMTTCAGHIYLSAGETTLPLTLGTVVPQLRVSADEAVFLYKGVSCQIADYRRDTSSAEAPGIVSLGCTGPLYLEKQRSMPRRPLGTAVIYSGPSSRRKGQRMKNTETLVEALVLCVAIMLLMPAETYSQPYDYQIQEIRAAQGIDAKIAACQIPDTILYSMSTSDLLETVLDYPLLINLLAYPPATSLGIMKAQFNGLSELVGRQDAPAVLTREYCTTLRPYTGSKRLSDTQSQIERSFLQCLFLESLLMDPVVDVRLTDVERTAVLQKCNATYQEWLVADDGSEIIASPEGLSVAILAEKSLKVLVHTAGDKAAFSTTMRALVDSGNSVVVGPTAVAGVFAAVDEYLDVAK